MYFLRALLLFFATSSAFAQPAVDDRVLLRATHHLGVPVHNLPQGTYDFRRVPDGTVGTITEIQHSDRWFNMDFDTGGVGWVSRKYIAQVVQPDGPPGDERETAVWADSAQCASAVAAGARMEKPGNSVRLATWNIRWFPKGCSPSENCDENATDLDWLACTITWMQADVISLQEMLDDPVSQIQLATLTDKLEQATGATWNNDLHDCGPEKSQHVGYLWNENSVTLDSFADAPALNGAFSGQSACAGNLRPGRYAKVKSRTSNGVDFQIYSIHLDSGVKDRDFQNRSKVFDEIPTLERDGEPVFHTDDDVIIAGDWNTMGRTESPEITGQQEILSMATTLHPTFRRVEPSPACSEYYEQEPGLLDHFAVSSGMQEAAITARVTGYCAVHQCNAISGQMPVAYERLSDHCPVVLDLQDADLDP